MIILILTAITAFAGGFYAGIKNADSRKVQLAKQAADLIKKV